MTDDLMISVIMPVFNAECFLKPAIQSILDQTFTDFELIIIDDGSKDNSFEVADGFRKLDSRIELIRLSINQGTANASNVALRSARGKYIARMDADDISMPERFSKQVEFMETHPDVGISGSGMQYMDQDGKLLSIPPLFKGDLSIHWHFMFESPFFNPTVIIRRSILDQHNLQYDISSVHAEDYELWSRLLPLTKSENLLDVLLHYRLHPESLTHRYRQIDINQDVVVNVAARAVKTYLPDLSASDREIRELQQAIWGVSTASKRRRVLLLPVYFKIWDEFCRKNHGDAGLMPLEREFLAWAARMLLFPPFQPGSINRLKLLTTRNWKWPLYLLEYVPYFLSRRIR